MENCRYFGKGTPLQLRTTWWSYERLLKITETRERLLNTWQSNEESRETTRNTSRNNEKQGKTVTTNFLHAFFNLCRSTLTLEVWWNDGEESRKFRGLAAKARLQSPRHHDGSNHFPKKKKKFPTFLNTGLNFDDRRGRKCPRCAIWRKRVFERNENFSLSSIDDFAILAVYFMLCLRLCFLKHPVHLCVEESSENQESSEADGEERKQVTRYIASSILMFFFLFLLVRLPASFWNDGRRTGTSRTGKARISSVVGLSTR